MTVIRQFRYGERGKTVIPRPEDPKWYRMTAFEDPGIVYLAESLITPGLYKIGETQRLRRRLAHIAWKHPVRLTGYILSNQRRWLERYLMGEWLPYHYHGEWFWTPAHHVEAFQSIRVLNWKGLPKANYKNSDFGTRMPSGVPVEAGKKFGSPANYRAK